MKRIAWLTIVAALMLVGTASAAYVSISTPQTVYVGDLLHVTGTTTAEGLPKPTINAGFSTEVVLYYAQSSKKEEARETIVVQEDGSFSATFETAGLRPGQYSIEIIDPTKTTFGSSSKTQQMVTLIDRSGSIKIDSPLNQDFDGTLDIRGSIADLGDAGVRILVEHDGFIVYSPTYVATDRNGAFAVTVPISDAGLYEITFSDTKGYIGSIVFTVTGTPSPTATAGPVGTNETSPALAGDATPTPAQTAPVPAALALFALLAVVLARRG